MLISHRRQFIFIHVWKTAGTSVQCALGRYTHRLGRFLPLRLMRHVGLDAYVPDSLWQQFCNHITAAELKGQLRPAVFDDYFKFAFIRNPWDLEVSLYHFVVRNRRHHLHQRVRRMSGFDEYIEWRSHARLHQQKDFLADRDGRLLVDFVGRFERLQQDFQHVCQTLRLTASLPHKNASKRREFRAYYNRRTENLVREIYRDDIALFDYEFDDRDLVQCASKGTFRMLQPVDEKKSAGLLQT